MSNFTFKIKKGYFSLTLRICLEEQKSFMMFCFSSFRECLQINSALPMFKELLSYFTRMIDYLFALVRNGTVNKL